jgi:hypothetical protein
MNFWTGINSVVRGLIVLALLITFGRTLAAAGEIDLLDMQSGAILLSHPGQFNEELPAVALIDGTTDYGWSSKRNLPLPASFVIELADTYLVERVAADNSGNDESFFPGISARGVRFSGSVSGPTEGFAEFAHTEVPPGGRAEAVLAEAVPVRWIRVTIESNHGLSSFTELMELEAYGRPAGPAAGPASIDGHFMSNYRMVQFRRAGDKVEGCYDLDNGYLWGRTDGRVMWIDWREHGGKQAGTAVLVMSGSGDFFNGLWYEQGKLSGTWFGTRDPERRCLCDIDRLAAEIGPNSEAGGAAASVQDSAGSAQVR